MTDGPTALVGEMAAWLAGAPPQPKVHASSLSANVAQLLLLPQQPQQQPPRPLVPPRIFAVAPEGTGPLVTLLAPFSRAALTAGCDDDRCPDGTDPAALERVCAHAAAALRTLCLDPALFPVATEEEEEARLLPRLDAHSERVARVLHDSVELEQLLWRVHAAAAAAATEEDGGDAQGLPPGALLRDLLAAAPVRRALGADYAFLATLLCGVPCGLNLRNVAWHGFAAPHELAPAHAALLRALVHAARAWLAARGAHAPRRAPRAVPASACAPLGGFVAVLQRACGADARARADAVHALVRASRFVAWDREAHVAALLTAALDAVVAATPAAATPATEEEVEGQGGRVLGVLLPQLEHALRRVYVAANALPARVLAPDYRRYYTTLEIVLQPAVVVRGGQLVARSAAAGTRFCRPKFGGAGCGGDDGEEEAWERPNRLAAVLGAGTAMLLHDCLTHAAGPRLRDRVAHGTAAAAAATPRALVAALLCALLRLCVRFCPAHDRDQRWAPVVAAVDAHVSCFHPARLAHAALVRAAAAVAQPLLAPHTAARLPGEYAARLPRPCAAAATLDAACAQDAAHTHAEMFLACAPPRLAAVQQLARVAAGAAAAHGALAGRVAALAAAVGGGSASRRAQDSCYRALPALPAWGHALQRVCAAALARFAAAQQPARAAARCEGLLARVPALAEQNAWDRVSALLSDAADAMAACV